MLFGMTLHQFLSIGLAALLFIVLGKWLSKKVPIPAVQDLFAAA